MASPRNRFSVPSNLNLITANGVPSFVTQFNTPLDTVETVRSFSGYATDRVALTRTLALDVGARADISRGLVQGRPGTPIAWNTLSPRAGLAWAVPHARGLILRGVYFRVYAPLAGRDLDFANPNSLSGSEYQWIDRNADGFYQPGEQGPLLLRFGGLYSSVDPSLRRPYSDEFDLSAEVSPAPGPWPAFICFAGMTKPALPPWMWGCRRKRSLRCRLPIPGRMESRARSTTSN